MTKATHSRSGRGNPGSDIPCLRLRLADWREAGIERL